MAFDINQTNAFVDGLKGKYDKEVKDNSVKYGRNAVSNHNEYMASPITNDHYNPAPILDFSVGEKADDANQKALNQFIDKNKNYLDSLPPLQYEYRYMPNVGVGKVDHKALLGAAYEELGKKEIPLKEFEENYLISKEMTAKPLDVNGDGKIDIAEYGANILAADVLSKGTTDVTKVDGTINPKGMNAILNYTLKANAAAATKLYSELYNTYNLSGAIKDFPNQVG